MERDNIRIEKIWEDGDLIEIQITAHAERINARQDCCLGRHKLEGWSTSFAKYNGEAMYHEFGSKTGKHVPAFSMDFICGKTGHVRIEMDMEIDDNSERKHRCMFYVSSEIGLINAWGKRWAKLNDAPIGYSFDLNPGQDA